MTLRFRSFPQPFSRLALAAALAAFAFTSAANAETVYRRGESGNSSSFDPGKT